MTSQHADDVEAAVRRYFTVVADLGSSDADLRAIVHPEVQLVERPNLLNPAGRHADAAAVLHGFRAGKTLLREQSFELHEILVSGDRAAVRATWQGVLATDAGHLPADSRLTAQVGAFLTVRDGQVLQHETFDCFEPPAPALSTAVVERAT
jgi:ketosteroid isomerase-like protein